MCRPHVGEGSFDQDQAGTTKESSKESTDGQRSKIFGVPSTKDEQSEDRQAHKIYWRATKPFAEMRRDDWSERDTKEIKRETQDGLCHRDIKLHHHTLHPDGQRGNTEGAAQSSANIAL